MEARKITIVQTKNQKKSVILSSATTLAELKDDLRTNGVDYDGMTFYEGLSKTELKSDESVLPHDIERNGTVTNELVFMLTNTQKKIRSGAASRADLYAEIKKLGLQETCKKKFGKNFTQCSTSDLQHLVDTNKAKAAAPAEKAPAKKEEVAPAVKHEEAKTEPTCNCNCNNVVNAVNKLVGILVDNDIITECEADEISDLLSQSQSGEMVLAPVESKSHECPYSDDEINKMFRGM